MYVKRDILDLCQRLSDLGLRPQFIQGTHLARGYADLGCEEFIVLSENKLCSLFTGAMSELLEQHRRFFFWIPSADQALNLLVEHGFQIVSLDYQNQRWWKLALKKGDKLIEVAGDTLHLLFLKALAEVLSKPH
ncbi:MAG TPA: hypothetical protein PKD37_01855 [Oligoflexia bacterium]|nr:hypothetical protein [Oligoflexia bacterium]HMP26722.1 hypothetical protein [Oligoflexia bacterium]